MTKTTPEEAETLASRHSVYFHEDAIDQPKNLAALIDEVRAVAATPPSAAPAEPTDLQPEREFLRELIAEVHRDQLPTNRLQNIAARAELRLRKLP